MHSNHEQELEARLDRELKSLPDVAAPADLIGNVLAAIQRRQAQPWYRRSWQSWPPAMKLAGFATLAAVFMLVCLGAWKLNQLAAIASSTPEFKSWAGTANLFYRTFATVMNAVALLFKSLGTTVIASLVALVVIGYVTCAGICTAAVRYAFARR